ncbi:hypothetical protein JTB14_014506 [Gonioctena quinquepunctata]|nr:hypothetical protein JTB14_014506 [Gonioctena quinquepunctata]
MDEKAVKIVWSRDRKLWRMGKKIHDLFFTPRDFPNQNQIFQTKLYNLKDIINMAMEIGIIQAINQAIKLSPIPVIRKTKSNQVKSHKLGSQMTDGYSPLAFAEMEWFV